MISRSFLEMCSDQEKEREALNLLFKQGLLVWQRIVTRTVLATEH